MPTFWKTKTSGVKVFNIHEWIANLDWQNSKNTVCPEVLSKCFGDRLKDASIYRHAFFWPKLISSIVCSIHHRPETTMCWINFELLNLINQQSEESLVLPKPKEMVDYLMPFLQIEEQFQIFAQQDDNKSSNEVKVHKLGQYKLSYTRVIPGKSEIALSMPKDVVIAKISEEKVSEVVRNTYLLITLLICLYDGADVRDLVMNTNRTILKFLYEALFQFEEEKVFKNVQLQGIGANVEAGNQNPETQAETLLQLQTVNFALLSLVQCFNEFPADWPFEKMFDAEMSERIDQINECITSYQEHYDDYLMGRISSWLDKTQCAAISLQALLSHIRGKLNAHEDRRLVGLTTGMVPVFWGHWVYGNYALGHQTYQYLWKKPPVVGCKYYAEIRPLTTGPIKVGFASDVMKTAEETQESHIIENAICYDYYENNYWINQHMYTPSSRVPNNSKNKSNESRLVSQTFPKEHEQVIIGILLDTAAQTELEAVRFFVNGQEVGPVMDFSTLKPMSEKPWTDPSNYYLSIAPCSYQQAVFVLFKEYWMFNRDNEEYKPLEDKDEQIFPVIGSNEPVEHAVSGEQANQPASKSGGLSSNSSHHSSDSLQIRRT